MARRALYNKIDTKLLERQLDSSSVERITLSFYRYHQITDPVAFRDQFYALMDRVGVLGRIYVAAEGINGQLSVPKGNFSAFQDALTKVDWMEGMRLNIAIEDNGKSFAKLVVKVREKIVADGLDDNSFNPSEGGQHLDAAKFNKLAAKDETIIVDMRNHYESEVGHFKGAIRPDADTFREALKLITDSLSDKKEQPIVMYCTGGIRCEKASAWLKHNGYKNVYQLDGGIINYARQVENEGLENYYVGKNFVFDRRMGERITEEVISNCHQCGQAADTHVNCANDACHQLFIQCASCAEKHQGCCSEACVDFMALPEEEQRERRKDGKMKRKDRRRGRLS